MESRIDIVSLVGARIVNSAMDRVVINKDINGSNSFSRRCILFDVGDFVGSTNAKELVE